MNQACNCCAFHDPELEDGFDEDVNYCGAALCRDTQRVDNVSVIFITDEDLLKLKMRGEL